MGKKYQTAKDQIKKVAYGIPEALSLIKSTAYAKFDETVDLAIRLGVDPKHSDQMVRGSVVLPHGTGKKVRIAVFAKGEKDKEAREAGADFVGAEELAEKINKGWMEFDRVVATPDLMAMVGKLGKILGPRGLMPNPKTGTVTFDIAKAIGEIMRGRVEFKVEKAGIIHLPIGKLSFDVESLAQNLHAALDAVVKAKPASVKGTYIRSITVSSTMGPGIPLDVASVVKPIAA